MFSQREKPLQVLAPVFAAVWYWPVTETIVTNTCRCCALQVLAAHQGDNL